jgi:hypothetical protein
MGITITNKAKAGLFFRPVAGVLPAGILATDAYNATAQTFTNSRVVSADLGAAAFNIQGQRWVNYNSEGVMNTPTDRAIAGVPVGHVLEFEFLFTGLALDIAFVGSSYYDSQVYVEYGGRMYKVRSEPLAGTTTGAMNRRLTFASQYHGRIRVHLGGGKLTGIRCEESAIIKPAPDRLLGVCDGGGWADGTGFKQASGTSYLTAGLCDFLFERTGMTWTRQAQVDTGFFCNGTATVTDDTAAANASTRWFSAARKTLLGAQLAAKPLFYLLVGAYADGGRSGATGAGNGPMATRALECYQWVRGQDSFCSIVHVSMPPFTGAGAAGTVTGPPTAGSPHDYNRLEQQAAIANVPRAQYVNAFGPTAPWFTGAGSNGSPTTSQQAGLIGADGVNPTAHGFNFYAGKIATELAQMLVYEPRARRQA